MDKYFSLRIKTSLSELPAAYPLPRKALILTNIQGNFRGLLYALQRGKVINEKGSWAFGDGHLIVMGDVKNIFADHQECLWYLYGLEEKAQKHSGGVHYIISTAERQLLGDTWPFSQPLYAINARSRSRSYAVLYDGNNELRRWLLTKNVLEKAGPFLFVQGVPDAVIADRGLPLSWLNKKGRATHLPPVLHPDKQLVEMLADNYAAQYVITAVPETAENASLLSGLQINVLSILRDDFMASVMIAGKHLYRFNTKGEKEKLV